MATIYLVQTETEYVNYVQSLLPTKQYSEEMLKNHWELLTTNQENGLPKLYATRYSDNSGNNELIFRRGQGGITLEFIQVKSLGENLVTVLRSRLVYFLRRIRNVFLGGSR